MGYVFLTEQETSAVEEALTYAREELKAAEEQTDFVLTSGANELITQALLIIRKAAKHAQKELDDELSRAYAEEVSDESEFEEVE